MPYLKYFESPARGLVFASLGPGDLLLEGIEEIARGARIHTGVVLTGLGNLTKASILYQGRHLDLERDLEVLSFQGAVADFVPHVHIAMVDTEGAFFGGHLKAGSVVKTVAEFAVMRAPDMRLARRRRDGSPVDLLDIC
jgi:predicted DNA-binding protein with PD1-like motif